jgi:hypothetical protein
MVKQRFARLFDRADEFIAGAVADATAATKANRDATDRIKADVAAADREIERLGALLVDPDVAAEPSAKKALLRRMGEAEANRDALKSSLDALREDANQNTDALAAMVRQVFDEAKHDLAAAVTPEAFNRLIDRFVGPMEIRLDGTVAQKETPATAVAGVQIRPIAGEDSNLRPPGYERV